MQVGDIYRFKPEFLARFDTWRNGPRYPGDGPYKIIAVDGHCCDVQSLADGRTYTSWAANPPHWGNFDPFLTAAYKANHPNDL